ncbi:MAG: hypothetical protein WC511_03085 [Candidatus Pacearchaeota archaeon]
MLKYSQMEEIEGRIAELAKSSTYASVAVTHRASDIPTVGLWWYFNGVVVGHPEKAENCENGAQICTGKEHNRVWPFLQKEYAEKYPEVLDVAYNQVERGRVWYIPADKSFLITCSTNIKKDGVAIQKIQNFFNLFGKRVVVQAQPALYDREIKLK